MDAKSSALIILIVDDDIGAVNALGRLLRTYGHAVHISYSALETLELASRIKPDLILHDITMPVIDGYEAARRLRKVPLLSRMVLIACSGSVDKAKVQEAGFDGWLEKPISGTDLDTLLAMVVKRMNPPASTGQSAPVREPGKRASGGARESRVRREPPGAGER